MNRHLVACLALLASNAVVAQKPLLPIESVDGATRAKWLVDGIVIDSETDQPVRSFVVTPGTMAKDEKGETVIRWRDNLKRSMKDGKFQWPRTSGFSVMRFRVSADGYRQVVTQKINRGGPHTRIRLKLVPIKSDGTE